ncbi:hypothetical protein WG902_19235 [Ramlibacter sp. PS3R-8]|uniref:hypothetical protein n=1 Tax=Ramlibacter sp. PS3R-8 TaxID=3133437 RepID=UPI0030A83ED5
MIAVLHWLPRWLLRALDRWSHRVAQRRGLERQRRWLARGAKPVAAGPAPAVYHLKPWRD